jgi:hypothetical protein
MPAITSALCCSFGRKASSTPKARKAKTGRKPTPGIPERKVLTLRIDAGFWLTKAVSRGSAVTTTASAKAHR